MSGKLPTNVTTPEFRISYPHVFKPTYNTLAKKEEYSLEAIFPKEIGQGSLNSARDKKAWEQMKIACHNACVNKWGSDQTKWPKNLKSPIRDQSEKEKDGKLAEGLVAGAKFCRFKADGSKQRPGIVDQQGIEILEESKFYAGAYARANVTAFAYDQAGNKGVSFGLQHLQFMRDGQPFSSRPSIENAFEKIDLGDTDGVPKTASDLF